MCPNIPLLPFAVVYWQVGEKRHQNDGQGYELNGGQINVCSMRAELSVAINTFDLCEHWDQCGYDVPLNTKTQLIKPIHTFANAIILWMNGCLLDWLPNGELKHKNVCYYSKVKAPFWLTAQKQGARDLDMQRISCEYRPLTAWNCKIQILWWKWALFCLGFLVGMAVNTTVDTCIGCIRRMTRISGRRTESLFHNRTSSRTAKPVSHTLPDMLSLSLYGAVYLVCNSDGDARWLCVMRWL